LGGLSIPWNRLSTANIGHAWLVRYMPDLSTVAPDRRADWLPGGLNGNFEMYWPEGSWARHGFNGIANWLFTWLY
jgi:hypothetical protein